MELLSILLTAGVTATITAVGWIMSIRKMKSENKFNEEDMQKRIRLMLKEEVDGLYEEKIKMQESYSELHTQHEDCKRKNETYKTENSKLKEMLTENEKQLLAVRDELKEWQEWVEKLITVLKENNIAIPNRPKSRKR